MSEATLTSKGQITIPVDIRTDLSLNTGEKVVFTTLDNGTVIMRPKNKSILELRGMLSEFSPDEAVSVDDMRFGVSK